MPRGDKTGPEGKGPMTGRGAGNCKSTGGVKGNQPQCEQGRMKRQRRRRRDGGGTNGKS